MLVSGLWYFVSCEFCIFQARVWPVRAHPTEPSLGGGQVQDSPSPGASDTCGDRDGSSPGWNTSPHVGVRIRPHEGNQHLRCFQPAHLVWEIGIFRIFLSKLLSCPWCYPDSLAAPVYYVWYFRITGLEQLIQRLSQSELYIMSLKYWIPVL